VYSIVGPVAWALTLAVILALVFAFIPKIFFKKYFYEENGKEKNQNTFVKEKDLYKGYMTIKKTKSNSIYFICNLRS
jgi:hypothetical protein